MNSSSCSFFLFVFSIAIPCCLSNPDLFTSCNTKFVCGNLEAGYPFFGGNRPVDCGIPGLELKCVSGTTKLDIKGIDYRVLEINGDGQILRIAREDYTKDFCKPQFLNTSLDSQLLEYAPGYRNLTLVYGCPVIGIPALPLFNCSIAGSVLQTGYAIWDSAGPGSCYRSISVPVYEFDLLNSLTSLTRLQDSLKNGFEVKLKIDNKSCSDCASSKGACGYDLFSKQTICYCAGQIYGSEICANSSPDAVVPAERPGESTQ